VFRYRGLWARGLTEFLGEIFGIRGDFGHGATCAFGAGFVLIIGLIVPGSCGDFTPVQMFGCILAFVSLVSLFVVALILLVSFAFILIFVFFVFVFAFIFTFVFVCDLIFDCTIFILLAVA
jgi:hypothetical protein